MSVGGKREGAGRPPGTPNKTTADIKALAQSYGPAAIMRLATLAGLTDGEAAESQQTQVAATKELLDRGFGKAVQPTSGLDAESNPIIEVVYRWDTPKPE